MVRTSSQIAILLLLSLTLASVTCQAASGSALRTNNQPADSSKAGLGTQVRPAPFDPRSCPPGTYPSMDQCLPLGPNCVTYNSGGHCLSCKINMELKDGRCVPAQKHFETCLEKSEGGCSRCAANTNNPRPGYCEQIEPNCKAFNLQGSCRACKGGLVLESNLCFTHIPSLFYYEDEHCLVWSKGNCTICEEGWNLEKEGQACVKFLAFS